MKNKVNLKNLKQIIILTIFVNFFSVSLFANSSWHWLTEITPWEIVPLAVVISLLIEWLLIIYLGQVSKKWKTIGILFIANLASFALPLLIDFWLNSLYDSFSQYLGSGPHYLVFSIYYFVTIVIELPIIYRLLSPDSKSKPRLIISIVLANLLTTIIAAVLERSMTYGKW